MTDIYSLLATPFPVATVSWRVGPTNAKKQSDGKPTRGQALAYIDARDVANRLDAVVGPANWQNRYSHAEGQKTVCEIGIKCDGEWVWKADGAGDSDMEAEKGALSDAFKRAAVRWGIGRYLYDLPAPWVEINAFKQIAESEMGRLRDLLTQVSNGSAMPTPTRDVATKSSAAAKRDGKYEQVQREMREAPTREALKQVAEMHKDWIGATTEGWQDVLRGVYEDRYHELKERDAA